ncbi:YlbD family protein [Jeotgalibacillus aurantiacus]|uniref:YlbD family protein n=1 Tax=Jeotgalibacillus aurantiacus TaxID=2763266 RepID=UPI001D0ACD04|nr:YlbD family protein [Jeotgalibacillus aurantiacus]
MSPLSAEKAAFKKYLTENPHLIEKGRKREVSWQELYEEWILFKDQEQDTSDTFIHTLKKKFKELDREQIESYTSQVQDVIDLLNDVLGHIQHNQQSKNQSFMSQWKQE